VTRTAAGSLGDAEAFYLLDRDDAFEAVFRAAAAQFGYLHNAASSAAAASARRHDAAAADAQGPAATLEFVTRSGGKRVLAGDSPAALGLGELVRVWCVVKTHRQHSQ